MLPDWKSMTSDERTEAIRPLADERMSASEIAACFTNVTRSAVIGHATRHGVALRSQENRRPATPRPPHKPVERRAPVRLVFERAAPPPPPKPIKHGPVPFGEAISRGLCKWPLWDRLNDLPFSSPCCGAPRAAAGPYCAEHAREAKSTGTVGERDAERQLRRAYR